MGYLFDAVTSVIRYIISALLFFTIVFYTFLKMREFDLTLWKIVGLSILFILLLLFLYEIYSQLKFKVNVWQTKKFIERYERARAGFKKNDLQ